MTVRELIDSLHDKLLKSYTRGSTITHYDTDKNPVSTEDHTDHHSREAVEADAEKIKAIVDAHVAELKGA